MKEFNSIQCISIVLFIIYFVPKQLYKQECLTKPYIASKPKMTMARRTDFFFIYKPQHTFMLTDQRGARGKSWTPTRDEFVRHFWMLPG